MQWFQDLVGGFAILFLVGSIVAAGGVLIFSTLAVFFMKNPTPTPPRTSRGDSESDDFDHPGE